MLIANDMMVLYGYKSPVYIIVCIIKIKRFDGMRRIDSSRVVIFENYEVVKGLDGYSSRYDFIRLQHNRSLIPGQKLTVKVVKVYKE